jgi:hypothetical protein
MIGLVNLLTRPIEPEDCKGSGPGIGILEAVRRRNLLNLRVQGGFTLAMNFQNNSLQEDKSQKRPCGPVNAAHCAANIDQTTFIRPDLKKMF